jgi:uncharacterized protein YndB with AHSA1/START domain
MTPHATATPPADPAPEADRTLSTSRTLAASPGQIYAAFASGERLARWWGPKGFRNTFQVFEPRTGGAWRFVMHGPNGADYPNDSRFDALVPGERIVIRHLSGPPFTLTVTLAPEGAGTRLTWQQAFDSASECESVRRIVVGANEENLDRLEAELAGRSP